MKEQDEITDLCVLFVLDYGFISFAILLHFTALPSLSFILYNKNLVNQTHAAVLLFAVTSLVA